MRRVDYETGRVKAARGRLDQVRGLLRGAQEERDAYLRGRVQAITSGEQIRPVPYTVETLARMQSAVDYAAALEVAFEEQVTAAEEALEKATAIETESPKAA